MSRKKNAARRGSPGESIDNLLSQAAELLERATDPNVRARAISANDQLAAHVTSLRLPSEQGEEE